jgi:hypothetical protein
LLQEFAESSPCLLRPARFIKVFVAFDGSICFVRSLASGGSHFIE